MNMPLNMLKNMSMMTPLNMTINTSIYKHIPANIHMPMNMNMPINMPTNMSTPIEMHMPINDPMNISMHRNVPLIMPIHNPINTPMNIPMDMPTNMPIDMPINDTTSHQQPTFCNVSHEQNMHNNIDICFINVGGLKKKILYPEFIDFINDYDIVCMAETKCDDNVVIPGFKCIHKTRSRYRRISGGICIAVKSNIMPFVNIISNTSEYVLWITINKRFTNTNTDLVVGAVYIPPESSPYSSIESFDEIENELIEYFHNEQSIILMGDFNSKTKKRCDIIEIDDFETENLPDNFVNEADTKTLLLNNNMLISRNSQDKNNCNNFGNRLIDLTKSCNFLILNGRCQGNDLYKGSTTCKDSSLVDYALLYISSLNDYYPVFNVIDFSCLYSDVHNAIHVNLTSKNCSQLHNVPHISDHVNVNACNFKHDDTDRPKIGTHDTKDEFLHNIDTNKIKDLEHLLNVLNPLTTPTHELCESNITQVATQLNTILTDAAKHTYGSHKPKQKTPRTNKQTSKHAANGWFSDRCQRFRQKYNTAKKRYHLTKQLSDLIVLRRCSRKYKQTLNAAIRIDRKRLQNTLKNSRFQNPREFWKTFNKKESQNTSSKAQPDAIFDYFKSNYFAQDAKSPDTIPDTYADIQDLCDIFLNIPFTQDEISKYIHKLKCDKSPGFDFVRNEYIRMSEVLLLPLITKLFNSIMYSGIYPSVWSLGEIIPIYKNKGDEMDPKNYRPITLSSCISKLFSIALNERLSSFFETSNVISHNQGAFLKGTSTTKHLFALHSLIEYSKSMNKTLYCAFIDLSRAYDVIDRHSMFTKLLDSGVKGNFFNIIKSMYSNTKSYIKYNNLKSTAFIANTGIKQGCNLSCLIFAVYLNDLEETMENSNCTGITIHDRNNNQIMLQLFTLLYADDTIIMAHTECDLQYSLYVYAQYCARWKLLINTDKSKILVFGRDPKSITFTLNGLVLEREATFKYLGLIFSKNGRYINAIKHNIDKARRACFSISKRARQLHLSVSCHIHILNTIVKPILLYGCEIFCFEKLDIIDTFYTQQLKRILHLRKSTPDYMVYGETGCFPPSIDVKQRAMTFWLKTSKSPPTSLPKVCQNIVLDCHEKVNYHSKYVTYIKSSFDNAGLTYLFQPHTQHLIIQNHINLIKRRIKDNFIQSWNNAKAVSPKAFFYNIIKHSFGFEDYLDKLSFKRRIMLSKFRTCNHNLPIETGRWNGTLRQERTCSTCPGNVLGDEHHFLFECMSFQETRTLCINRNTYRHPNIIKTSALFNSTNLNVLNKLCLLIIEIMHTIN